MMSKDETKDAPKKETAETSEYDRRLTTLKKFGYITSLLEVPLSPSMK